VSRSQLKRLIDSGEVLVNGARVKAGFRLTTGDEVVVHLRPPAPTRAEPEDIPLTVLYEDEHLIVIDKQAGLVVHPAPGHPSGTLVNALLHHCTDLSGIGGELRPGIVHRLDKLTSGVMVATKDDATHQAMVELFSAHKPERAYVAVVAPPPRLDSGTFETLYGRHPVHRKKFSSKVKRGKRAVTHWRVVERFGEVAAEVRCRLETGRTHQIRVHFSDSGSPLVGDPMYGRKGKGRLGELAAQLGRQALHAELLGFEHPITGEPLRFRTEPPDDMQELLEALRSGS
jgi:23S rRNA pseudouridine1911/1915/1917 synthase